MLCKLYCAYCNGLIVNIVTVEVSVSDGIQFFLVGLADSAIKESQQRIASALGEYGYRIPGKKIVINLAPAWIRKEGSAFDLPIAIAILIASGQIKIDSNRKRWIDKTIILGELALDGSIRDITGALPIINRARKIGYKNCILPIGSAQEGCEIEDIAIYGVCTLKEAIEIIEGKEDTISKLRILQERYDLRLQRENKYEYDFNIVKGQFNAKRGLEIAAAGGHNVIMVGSPGSGKTLMAKCLPSILPPMNKEEAIQTSEIYSVANLLKDAGGLMKKRPFRSPHHTATIAALVGGGSKGLPGEISLAHNGVLFCDELAEFDRKTIDILRQPIENGVIEISRVKNKYYYPARFMFIGAMNPCPCGYLYDKGNRCTCTSSQIIKYQNKISGPILDRIDIFLKINSVKPDLILDDRPQKEDNSYQIAQRVLSAREVQKERYKREDFFTNSSIPQSKLHKYCKLEDREKLYIQKVVNALGISARGYSRILKIARTIADLKGEEKVSISNLSEAINFRYPDKNNSL